MVSHAQSTQDEGIVPWAAQQADTKVKNPLLRTIISLADMSWAEKGHVSKPCSVPPFWGNPCCWLGSGESCVPPLAPGGNKPCNALPFTPQQSCTGPWGHSRLTPPREHIWTPHNLDFLSRKVLISQTLQCKNALNAQDSFNVFTAYIWLFIKMIDVWSSYLEKGRTSRWIFIFHYQHSLPSIIINLSVPASTS